MNVAVLISVYRKDDPIWFELSLSSVFQQKFSGNIRVYLGCDGELTEPLEEVIDKYKSRLHLLHRSNKNLGLTLMLNALIDKLEDEEFIFRMDSDDINHLDRFQKQLTFLTDHPDVDIVGCSIEEIDENGSVILQKVSYPKNHEECKEFFKRRDPLAHPAVLFRRSYFKKAGKYNPAYRTNQDTYMWLSGFLSGCKFANLDEVLLSFRRSTHFYDRRGGFERAKNLLKLRFEISNKMHYGVDAYLYAILIFIFTLLPPALKKLMYQKLR